MEGKTDYIVIDAGNTFIKIALFKLSDIIEIQHFTIDELELVFKSNPEFQTLPGILSSVLSKENTSKILSLFLNCIELTSETKLPFQLAYATPSTLGKDRICNAAFAFYKNLNGNAVTIDIGTCIKFDLITSEKGYEGGSISPGIQLRYKSLNDYTANLPLIDNHGKIALVGKTTYESIHSGVINGIQSEINDLIIRYTEKYEGLTFFVTGGDAKHFDFDSKNNIFAIENLTLRGLSQIFLFNDQ
jgi:type III pantothenate kinase